MRFSYSLLPKTIKQNNGVAELKHKFIFLYAKFPLNPPAEAGTLSYFSLPK